MYENVYIEISYFHVTNKLSFISLSQIYCLCDIPILLYVYNIKSVPTWLRITQKWQEYDIGHNVKLQKAPLTCRLKGIYCRNRFVNAPSQWEATLQCNVFFHWLGPYTKLSLLLWVFERKWPCFDRTTLCISIKGRLSCPYSSCHMWVAWWMSLQRQINSLNCY